MNVEEIVPITRGQLRAFMYENYAKGQHDAEQRIIALLETLSFDVISTTELVEHHYRDGSTRMQPRRIDKDDLIALVKSETK